MSDLLTSIAPAIANHLWQTTAFAAVVWLATLALRRNQARIRYALWFSASAKFLLPFSLLVSLGSMLPRPHRAVTPPAVYATVDEVAQPFVNAEAPAKYIAAPTVQQPKQILPELIAGVWLCGVVIVLAVWATRWYRVWQTQRSAVFAYEGREFDLLQRALQATGHRQPTRLRLSQDLMEPGIFGIFRPALIWPQGLSQRLDDEHIEAIFIHELTHAQRRDNLTAALHMLVEVAFWFDPLVWWMERRMMEERERACDEAVVTLGRAAGIYAESLLKAVRFCVESPIPCVAGITGADLSKRVRSIMQPQLLTMGFWRKFALVALAIAALAGPVAFGVLRMIPVYGQVVKATGPLPGFEVATIKPSDPEAGGIVGFRAQGRHFDAFDTTAIDLIQYAYGIQARQIVGAPAWLGRSKYNIVAIAPDSSKNPDWNLMVRRLLAERFGLALHQSTRELPVYELQIARGGSKLKKSESSTDRGSLYFSRMSNSNGAMTLHAVAATMSGLAALLQTGPLERPVIDRTGLNGTFDFTVDFLPDTAKGADESSLGGNTNAPPGIFTAIQEQIGLKLEPARGPAEVVVIDHIEKPAFDSAATEQHDTVQPPVLTYSVEPEFTERALMAKASGTVLVSLSVDEQGNPMQVRALRRLGMGLDGKAIEAVKQYRFRPAMEDGRPVPFQLSIPVKFQIY